MDRRKFLQTGAVGLGLALHGGAHSSRAADAPRILSTHPGGIAVNLAALKILSRAGSALDAAEGGVMVAEADPSDRSVGLGGLPNREGVVELDAALMDGSTLEAGAVAALQGIKHPVAVARRVLDRTPHILLVGKGARRFALEQGFRAENLLTPEARQAWKKSRRKGSGPPDNHDTMGLIVLTGDGSMAVACSTSGAAWKLPGRVGDSPLVGHGLYCDGDAGAAAATGLGEEVIKVCGSYQVVEFMRQGMLPHDAVRRVLERMVRREPANRTRFLGFVAMRADGEMGYASTTAGFEVAVSVAGQTRLESVPIL